MRLVRSQRRRAVRWRLSPWVVVPVVVGLIVVLIMIVVSVLLIINVWRAFPDPPPIPSGAPTYDSFALDARSD